MNDDLEERLYRKYMSEPLDDYWCRRIAQGRLTLGDWQRRCREAARYTAEAAWEPDGSRWA